MAVNRFPIEEGAILAFARAIGDPNLVYSDRDYAVASEVGAVLAPPTFVQSSAHFDPDYPLRPKIGEPWVGSGKGATGLPQPAAGAGGGGPGLHAEQHYTYHRPLVAGDVLTATVRAGARRPQPVSKGAGSVRQATSRTFRSVQPPAQ